MRCWSAGFLPSTVWLILEGCCGSLMDHHNLKKCQVLASFCSENQLQPGNPKVRQQKSPWPRNKVVKYMFPTMTCWIFGWGWHISFVLVLHVGATQKWRNSEDSWVTTEARSCVVIAGRAGLGRFRENGGGKGWGHEVGSATTWDALRCFLTYRHWKSPCFPGKYHPNAGFSRAICLPGVYDS